jgi:hypothetical protein
MMPQVLHIFRKDGRRHWPEILVSLLLLGLYVRLNLHPWQHDLPSSFFFGRLFSLRGTITPALILFWFFVVLRVVHSENLVGDRQWWVTKPYVWWKLLIAKLLFVCLVICLPLFFIQLYFLHWHGFPVFRNISTILGMQIGLAIALFLPGLIISALTRTLGQAILTVVGIFLAFLGAAWLAGGFSDSAMTGPSPVSDTIQLLIYFLCATGVLLWQFARRQTWQSCGIVFVCVAILVVIANIPPDGKNVENEYRLVESNQAPIIVNLRSPDLDTTIRGISPDLSSDVSFQIPLKISGIAERNVILFNGLKLTLTIPDGGTWTRGWRATYGEVWPGDERSELSYEMKRQEYERLKNSNVRMQIELALSQFAEDQPRELILSSELFSDEKLGTCRINPLTASELECLRPFNSPGYIASVDPQQSPCDSRDDSSKADILHSWSYPNDREFVEPGISPINEYSIFFRSNLRLASPEIASERATHPLRLCSGTKVRIADPELRQRFRLKLELASVRLANIVRGAYSFD